MTCQVIQICILTFPSFQHIFQNELEKACADLQTNLAKEIERTTTKGEIIQKSKESLAQLQVSTLD